MSGSTIGRGSASDRISEEVVFKVLSNRRRRQALHYMLHNEGPFELGEVADQLAVWENNIAPEELTATQRKRTYTALQQNHLPRMDELDVIDYDQHRGTIEVNEAIEALDIYLEVVRGRDVPWSDYYLALAAVSLGLVVAYWGNFAPISDLPASGVALFVVVSLAISAGAHKWYSMRLGQNPTPPGVSRGGSGR